MARCVECGQPVDSLLTDIGRGNVVLATCPHCSKVSDKYVEFEYTILCLNLILCKLQAYRHLLFNSQYGRTSRSLLDLTLLVSFLDASLMHCEDLRTWTFHILHSLVLFSIYALGCQFVINALSLRCSLQDTFRALLLSSLAKLGAPMMLVWCGLVRQFPEFYMNLIFAFTYLDNCLAIRALTSVHRVLAVFVVLGGAMLAHIAKALITTFL